MSTSPTLASMTYLEFLVRGREPSAVLQARALAALRCGFAQNSTRKLETMQLTC